MTRPGDIGPLGLLAAIVLAAFVSCYAIPTWCESRGGRLVITNTVGCILPEPKGAR